MHTYWTTSSSLTSFSVERLKEARDKFDGIRVVLSTDGKMKIKN